jgi:N-acetylneuraminic acid mutarotase
MADKRFSLTLDASMDVSQILASIKKVQNGFDGLKINAAGQKSFNKVFSDLENAVKDFESKSGKEINNLGDMRAIEKSFGKVLTAYSRLKTEIKNIGQLSDSEILKMFPDTLDKSFD